MSYQKWFQRGQVSVKVVDTSHKGNLVEEGSLCLLPGTHLPQIYLLSFELHPRATFPLASVSRGSFLPAHSSIWVLERRWDTRAAQSEVQHHSHLLVLYLGVVPHCESKKSDGGNPPRSKVSPELCALFFWWLNSCHVVCSSKGLSCGFGNSGVREFRNFHMGWSSTV